MLTTYRRVLAHPGAFLFSATGLVARLPISMVGLGLVLLVSGATGSYGVAGSVSAAYLLANALVSILVGRLVDTLGQRRVLPVAVLVCTAGLLLTMTAVQSDWPLVLVYAGAVLAGMSMPPIGACVRARWSYVLATKSEVQTAYALEAVVDEAVFIVGPILVTVLATALHPLAGLTTALSQGWPAPSRSRPSATPLRPRTPRRRLRATPGDALAHDRAAVRGHADARRVLRLGARWPPSPSPTSAA